MNELMCIVFDYHLGVGMVRGVGRAGDGFCRAIRYSSHPDCECRGWRLAGQMIHQLIYSESVMQRLLSDYCHIPCNVRVADVF